MSDLIRGNQFLRSGQLEEAIAAYEKAIARNARFHWSYYKLGEALEQLERWEEAIAAYEKAIELNPNFVLPYYKLETVLLKNKPRISEIRVLEFLLKLKSKTLQFISPSLKAVVARRNDGLGTRLMCFLSARYVCEYFNCKLFISWPPIGSRYYSLQLINNEAFKEIFENGNIFKDTSIFLLKEENCKKWNANFLTKIKADFKKDGSFYTLNREQTTRLSQSKFLIWDEPYAIVPDGIEKREVFEQIKNYWNQINWHPLIIQKFKLFQEKVNNRSYLVVHFRRGDIIQRLLYDNLQVLYQGMRAIFNRFLPVKTAINFVLSSGFQNVVVCSECVTSTQILIDKVKANNSAINFYVTSEFAKSLSINQAAAYDLLIMSASTQILTSTGSSFSICAEFAGKTERAKISIDWEDIVSELFQYIDNQKLPDGNTRKSTICFYVAQNTQNQNIANRYINLSKKYSESTFKKRLFRT